jgi:chemotaxis protein methyltransferase CheR
MEDTGVHEIPGQRDEALRLRALVDEWCGLALGADDPLRIEARLLAAVLATGCADGEELRRAIERGDLELRDRFAAALAPRATAPLRDPWLDELLGTAILPEAAERARETSRLRVRIWCAGCGTGEEAYDVALLVRELCAARALEPLGPESFEIVATDVSREALAAADAPRWSEDALADIDLDVRERSFDLGLDGWALKSEVRKLVELVPFNLVDPFAALGRFDVVLMRGLLPTFTPATRSRIVGKVHHVLRPGGALILSPDETLDTVHHELQPAFASTAAFYRLTDD